MGGTGFVDTHCSLALGLTAAGLGLTVAGRGSDIRQRGWTVAAGVGGGGRNPSGARAREKKRVVGIGGNRRGTEKNRSGGSLGGKERTIFLCNQ